MIVYAARLNLTDDHADAKVVAAIESWLAQSKRLPDLLPLLSQPARVDLDSGAFIELARHDDSVSPAFAFRFAHPDRSVRGREWLVEVGVHGGGKRTTCTVVLQTREASAQVSADVQTTRPLVVPEILARCRLTSDTPGGRLIRLTEADCEAFDWSVRDPDRKHPILQVSPRPEGGYCVDPARLSDLLVGIADVVIIPEGTDTFAIADAIGSRFSAYHGAVNVLWPMVNGATGCFVPSTRLLAPDLEGISAQGRRPEADLLAMVAHRSNASIARTHLSPERVQALALRAALDTAKSHNAEESELTALYRDVDEEQRARIASLQNDLEDEEGRRSEAESKVRELEAAVKSLSAQLQRVGSTTPAAAPALSGNDRDVIVRAMAENAGLIDCLEAIEKLYKDRVVVLDSARTSARKASKFNAPKRAFALMATLCGNYYDALSGGKGDTAARELFGKNSFATKESETVEGNKRAGTLRTFSYKGCDIPMMAHLKIGVKDSVAETFRCHFHWDAEDRVVVIGHCGKHLDHK
ncbi:MAG: hypothetical protein IT431_00980 [Phycisphaerales bacterium]|nr:hypothetical protein [Phycisphaerales bacterium]